MISVVIPVYNEEKNITALMDRLTPIMQGIDTPYEIILVDDGSSDRSLSLLKVFASCPEVKVVELTRNYGQHAAIMAGFSQVRGEIIITLDADLQIRPKRFPDWLPKWWKGILMSSAPSGGDARIPFSGSCHPRSSI
jgi:undecaprenyl-phosphate 4-deoxy-4-formamido-L-arabinose transferase